MAARSKLLPQVLRDPSQPLEMRFTLLKQVCLGGDDADDILLALLQELDKRAGKEEYVAKLKELSEFLKQLEAGPLRSATFDRLVKTPGGGERAQVILRDGEVASCMVRDAELTAKLRRGDTVWLDGQGKALLFHEPDSNGVGEEAKLERELPEEAVEVSLGELGRYVYRTSSRLREQLEAGDAGPGSTVIVCPRRMMAFRAVPEENGFAHLRFLSRKPVPDVVVERDIGAPPRFISSFIRHLERELGQPDIGRRYRVRRSCLQLLAGVPGSGKSHAILGFWNHMYRIMSDVTGVPIGELPQRVMELKSSQVLSKWFGSSDQKIARFFEELEALAAERFVAPDGTEYELPVLLICEEIDGLARERGESDLHDRVMTNLLAGLDPGNPVFRDKLVFVVCTTNAPDLVDPAFVRRAGGRVEHFGRMERRAFRAVLECQLRDRAFRRGDAESETAARHRAVADLAAWLFAPNQSEPGQVELTYVGASSPVVKHRRDFLTAALVDRAVDQASKTAAHAEWLGDAEPGLTSAGLMTAIDEQVRQTVDQLTPQNAGRYLTLPDATRVASVRRIDQRTVLPLELERAS